uniref:RING-type domain-containing protein n=1 Tax=Hemiselmis andersenii TaxID=464988 RepID=A0A7S1HBD3_HEMAN|mmetsp:Transcript_49014/g.118917  ORF Transcript_49014/g.118917 Transcript_49014/m.118917 type:complete len:819 (+) Transcript_49014:74-2530(+)
MGVGKCFGPKKATEAARVATAAPHPTNTPSQISTTKRPKASSAHISHIERVESDYIREVWSAERDVNFPWNTKAYKTLTLNPSWASHTSFLRRMREADLTMAKNSTERRKLEDQGHFEEVVVAVVRKGYMLSSNEAARIQRDAIHDDKEITKACVELWNAVQGRKRMHLSHAFRMIGDFETPAGIVAKLSEVCDRAHRCMSAKNQAFVLIVTHGYNLWRDQARVGEAAANDAGGVQELEGQEAGAGEASVTSNEAEELIDKALKAHFSAILNPAVLAGGGFSGALSRVYECVEIFLDEHKEKAFNSAFIEPARFYFDLVGDDHQRDHVNVHGINWYLALLHGGIGVQLPLLSAYKDGDRIGICDFWHALTGNAWKLFAAEGNFGKAFEGIKEFRDENRSKFLMKRVPAGQLPVGLESSKAMHLGNTAVESNSKQAPRLAVYLERYAHFFRRDWLTRRMFENLNAESLPEYAGFRKACETLYLSYPLREAGKESFIEFAYADEYYTELDVVRVGEFFEWIKIYGRGEWWDGAAAGGMGLGLGGSPAEVEKEETALGRKTCPICMEEKDDVAVLEHWKPQGDVSEHKMCGECLAQWQKEEKLECPFCRELLHADEMTKFIKNAIATINHQQNLSPDEAAAIMEQWQMLEMMLQGQQTAIRRVAKLVVEHNDFKASILKGTAGKCRWLRDMAGVVFRLDSMYKDGELKVSAANGKMLANAVEAIMSPIEGCSAEKLDPHFYGALYSQAVCPWLCAWRGEASTATAAEHVRRVGRAIAYGVKKHNVDRERVKDRLVDDYVMMAHEPVWGGQQRDALYQALYR